MTRAAIACALLCLAVACSGSSSSLSSARQRTEPSSLYTRIGGVEVLRALIDEWVLEVGSDARIRDYFVDTDIAILKLRLLERVCVLVGGPCVYKGRELYEAHAHLDLEDRHLTAFLEGLEPAMERVKIEGAQARELRELVRGLAAELAIAVGSEGR